MARGHLGLAVAAASVALSVTVPLSDATAHQANRFASPSMASTPPNICGTNATIGQAFLAAVNLSYPGLEAAKEAAKLNDLAGVCDAVVKYYRQVRCDMNLMTSLTQQRLHEFMMGMRSVALSSGVGAVFRGGGPHRPRDSECPSHGLRFHILTHAPWSMD